uniref:Uncharacterized protein n=1 Tax=Moniliophthora roreri TaxID=221103 RepID=A0A0W0GD20_MONRR
MIIKNHSSVKEYPEVVDNYITKELAASRFSGPFSKQTMETIMWGPFISLPFIVLVQDQGPDSPPKYHVCQNLSKETQEQCSVNSFIKKESFPTHFHTATRVAELVASAPPGTQACMLDIAKFHCTCPVLPHYKPFLVV